jgi:hypothetical protein
MQGGRWEGRDVYGRCGAGSGGAPVAQGDDISVAAAGGEAGAAAAPHPAHHGTSWHLRLQLRSHQHLLPLESYDLRDAQTHHLLTPPLHLRVAERQHFVTHHDSLHLAAHQHSLHLFTHHNLRRPDYLSRTHNSVGRLLDSKTCGGASTRQLLPCYQHLSLVHHSCHPVTHQHLSHQHLRLAQTQHLLTPALDHTHTHT